MQTVSFQCGHCHKLMGVTSAYLGKQVRCPHCQQVVLAPAAAPAPAAPPPAPTPAPPPQYPTFSAPPGPGRDEYESIFGQEVQDDLFGTSAKPKIELPREPARPNLQLEPTVFQLPGVGGGHASPPADPGPTVSMPNDAPHMTPGNTAVAPAPGDWNAAPPPPMPGADGAMQPVARLPQRSTGASSGILWIIIYALAFYGVLMTIVALMYLVKSGNATISPYDWMQDEGRPKATKSQSLIYKRPPPWGDLPPHLHAALKQTLQLGDLEVEPIKVEQKPITWKYRSSGHEPVRADYDSLVLHLRLKNISKDTVFRPTDSFFDREWHEDKDNRENLPFTHLAANGHYFCSPFAWKPSRTSLSRGDNLRDEFAEGQEDDKKILNPGDEVKTVIVTDPKERVPELLRNFNGKMEWRVQLRRGLVTVKDKDYSCTTLIAVEFSMSQVEKK